MDPLYEPGASAALDEIEGDPERQTLWINIVKILNEICEHPEKAGSRKFAFRLSTGQTVWRVPVPSGTEKENYSILWRPAGEDAVIHYVGVWPPPIEEP